MTGSDGALWPIDPIITERLTIREALSSDADTFARLLMDPDVRAHLGGAVAAEDVADRVERMPGRGVFLVETSAASTPIGLVHVGRHRTGAIELSYEFVPEMWGRGYALEACRPILRWARDRVAQGGPVIAVTQVANARSVALLTALGMSERERFVEFGAEQVLLVTPDLRRATCICESELHLSVRHLRV